jgi:hypothetical protein
MSVYRFRVTFEEFEDVSRDIDIRADQSLFELQQAILDAIAFDRIHGSAWFKSDDMWRKGKMLEQSEIPVTVEKEHPLRQHTLAKLINNPHQKFLFFYDLKEEWVFMVELIRVIPNDPKAAYPLMSRKSGMPPKQYKIVIAPSSLSDDDEDDDDKPAKPAKTAKPAAKAPVAAKAVANHTMDDDDEPDDDEIEEKDDNIITTADSYDSDEVDSLEGEEGEEEEKDSEYGEGDHEYGQNDDFGGGYGGGDDDDRY